MYRWFNGEMLTEMTVPERTAGQETPWVYDVVETSPDGAEQKGATVWGFMDDYGDMEDVAWVVF